MLKAFDTIKAQLAELAPAINAFKSEAVQLRIVELIFAGRQEGSEDKSQGSGEQIVLRRGRKRRASDTKDAKSGSIHPTKRKAGSTGPVVSLNELIDAGFFAKRRTLTDIIEHCRSNKAKNFRPDQLSGPLARAVRDDKLKRQKNNDGQYEYWK